MAWINLVFDRGHYAGGRTQTWFVRKNPVPGVKPIIGNGMVVEVAPHAGPGVEGNEWRYLEGEPQ